MNIRTPYGGSLAKGETGFGPSQTVPDQSMSINEILRRFVSGLPIGGQRVPFYEDDESDDIEDTMPMHMDKIERIEWMRSNEKKIKELTLLLNEQQARSQAAEIKSKSLKTPPEAENTITSNGVKNNI